MASSSSSGCQLGAVRGGGRASCVCRPGELTSCSLALPLGHRRPREIGESGSPSIWTTRSSLTKTRCPQPTAQYGQTLRATRSAVLVRAVDLPGARRGDRRPAAENVARPELPDDRPVQDTQSAHEATVAHPATRRAVRSHLPEPPNRTPSPRPNAIAPPERHRPARTPPPRPNAIAPPERHRPARTPSPRPNAIDLPKTHPCRPVRGASLASRRKKCGGGGAGMGAGVGLVPGWSGAANRGAATAGGRWVASEETGGPRWPRNTVPGRSP